MINKSFKIFFAYAFCLSYVYSYDWGAWPETSQTTTPLVGESGHPHSYQQHDDLGYQPSSDLAFSNSTDSYIPMTEPISTKTTSVIPSQAPESTIPGRRMDRQESITTPQSQFSRQQPESDVYAQSTIHRGQSLPQAAEQQEQYSQQQAITRTQPDQITSPPQQQDTPESPTTPQDTSNKSVLSGIRAALTALGSLKHHKDHAEAEPEEASESKIASSTTQIRSSPKIVTKNFSCNKTPAQCQKEWDDLVKSIESNPQYEILTKQKSCDIGTHNKDFIAPAAPFQYPRLSTPEIQQSRPLSQQTTSSERVQKPQIPTNPEVQPMARQQA